jgi:hypothetical protein
MTGAFQSYQQQAVLDTPSIFEGRIVQTLRVIPISRAHYLLYVELPLILFEKR